MPETDWGWLITPEELEQWVVAETADVIALHKPAGVVCHPSKRGPWSSVAGACREHFELERVHMPFRLDRETSGILVLAKNVLSATRLQSAVQQGRLTKTYHAILSGSLPSPVVVNQPIGRDTESAFYTKRCVTEIGAQPAETEFLPLHDGGGYTLVEVHPKTGRTHQIRVHAGWMGLPVVGDKLYGSDASLMMEFMEQGFTARLSAALPLPRQALHASRVSFLTDDGIEEYCAPLADDLIRFCREHMDIENPL